MTEHDALNTISQLPARRSVQELRDALAGMTAGDTVRAVFKTDRYGVFVVDGAVRTSIGGDLSVGAHLLGNAARVEGELVRVLPSHPAPELPAPDRQVDPATLEHGDVVRAYLQHDVHGLIALTGPVTESDHDRFRLIGSWIVTDDGRFAPRVAAVEHLATGSEHILAIPNRRQRQDGGIASP